MSKIVWIGTKESDIFHTNDFFSNSITACGSGKNGNFSFSSVKNMRINYNMGDTNYTKYLLEKMADLLKEDSSIEFMYYNPCYAHLLNSSLASHVCCLNSASLMNLLRSKCEMRSLASEYIPIVPFERMIGHDLSVTPSMNAKSDTAKYIIQENISSGGEGTYIISNTDKVTFISDEEVYLISPYYENNIPININFIIFDNDIVIFPPSVQVINQLNGKMLFMGTDYHFQNYSSYIDKDIILNNTRKLASALKDMGYRGIGGFDYIFTNGQLLFLECNPRFQASTYLLNFVLEKENLLSVHELNYMAFAHHPAPKYDFYSMEVPYSCIAYSYQSYLKNSIIKKEWRTHSNVVEILEDGLNSVNEFVDNAYLYRIIFSTSITDMTPNFHLVTYNSLLPDSSEWHHKVVSGDKLALKVGLLNQGIYIAEEVLEFIKQTGGMKDATFNSIDIILDNDMTINCPYKINYADFSPFSLNVAENENLELYYYHERLSSVSLEPVNQNKDRLTRISNIPYRNLSYIGGDRLRIHHTDICIFKTLKNNCKFCNLPVSRFDYQLEDIYEVIDFYLKQGGFRHILIGGASEPISKEKTTIITLAKYIRSKTDMPIYLMCLPIQDISVLKELYDAGITEIGFNIEIWNDESARRIMPGKGSIPRQDYLTALKNAKKIWKNPYAVRSILVVGLEETKYIVDAVQTLSSEGIMPILSIFRPLPHSQMSNSVPPTNDYLYSLYNQLDLICRKHHQHLGPDCIICQNNTLSLPW